MQKLHRSEFLKELKTRFPQLTHSINQQYGLLHLEMSVFTEFVQSLIDAGDKEHIVRALQLADKYFREGDRKIQNALVVSFLEHLNFVDGRVPRQWAKAYLSTALLTAYDEIMAYNKAIQE